MVMVDWINSNRELDQLGVRAPDALVQAGAALVHELCTRLDLTADELAAYLDVPESVVVALARGQQPVTAELLAELIRRARW